MPGTFQYDVFLSHNQADKPQVRRLAERLRAAGPFKFGTRNSEFGIPKLRLSPAALGSDWVGLACPAEAPWRKRTCPPKPWRRWERSTVGRGNLPFRDPANAGRRFISLHLAAPHRLSPGKTALKPDVSQVRLLA